MLSDTKCKVAGKSVGSKEKNAAKYNVQNKQINNVTRIVILSAQRDQAWNTKKNYKNLETGWAKELYEALKFLIRKIG